MGSVYGARLAMGGAAVTLLDVNDAHLAAVNSHGLLVALDDGNHRIQMPAMRPENYHGPADLFLLFTKIFHTASALESVKEHLPTTPVLSLQNGLGNDQRIKQFVPAEKVCIGMTMTPAEWLGPGSVASHGSATTSLYSANGAHLPVLDEIISALQAGGIDAKADPDIHATIWQKAAFNCAMNAICALTDATPGAMGGSDAGRDLADRVACEAVAVAGSCGIKVDLGQVRALITHAYENHLFHEPSMLQDRKAKRRTEIDALNLAVVKIGRANGIDTPVNHTIGLLVKLVEDNVRWQQGKGNS